MDAKTRETKIVDYLKKNGNADVATLSTLFQVSEMTIRRDLSQMEKENLLIRVHGGARLVDHNMYEPPLKERLRDCSEEKIRLGRYAASFVEEGDAVAVDDSSTTLAMIPYIQVPVTIITNHINVATALAENDQIDVILLGGEMRKQTMSMVGKQMEKMLSNYVVDKAFLSAKALDPGIGILDATAEVGNTKQAYMRSSRKTYFVMDHTKLNKQAFYKVCDVERITNIIMDRYEPDMDEQVAFETFCRKRGINLYLVD